MGRPARGGKAVARQAARLSRLARRLIAYDPGPPRTHAELTNAAASVVWLARFFYLFVTYYIFAFGGFTAIVRRPPSGPQWPVALLLDAFGGGWVEYAPFIAMCAAVMALLAAALPGALVLRLGVFFGVFILAALRNSYGAINHEHYIIVYASFALLFLPPRIGWGVGKGVGKVGRISRTNMLTLLRVFWLTQALALLPYTLSGYWKIRHSGLDLFSGDAMARLLLDRIANQAADIPPLLPLVVANDYIAQALLLGAVYMQIFALFALFRPHLHRPVGIGLILFHFGTGWLLNIPFEAHVVVNGLFLVFSPLAPRGFSGREFVGALPGVGEVVRVIGWVVAWLGRRR